MRTTVIARVQNLPDPHPPTHTKCSLSDLDYDRRNSSASFEKKLPISRFSVCRSRVAVVLPYRRKEFAQFMPGEKWRVPFVSIIGAISALFMAANFWFAATTPAVGPSTAQAGTVLIGIFLIGLLVYVGAYYYRKSRGIDLHLVYREVPPE